MNAGLILILAVPVGPVALAVVLDRRTRRGYGLGLLAAVVLALNTWGIITVTQAEQRVFASHTDNLGFAMVEAVAMLLGLYVALVLVLGGITEASLARQRWWLALIVAGSFVPALIILAPGTALVPDVLGSLGISRGAQVTVLLILPALIIFAYALVRTLRPVAR